jgi:hypothetical protein
MGRTKRTRRQQLRDAGISPKQAENWEKLGAVPDKEFEASLADPTAMPTTNGIIRANVAPKPKHCTRLGYRCSNGAASLDPPPATSVKKHLLEARGGRRGVAG